MSPPGEREERLLLIEDDDGQAMLITEMLQAAGCEFSVVHVASMAAALAKLATTEFTVVLLDIHLPDAVGQAAVENVRGVAGETPIVVLTGSDDPSLALRCIEAGAQDFLEKDDTNARSLQRAIGYATSRVREAQLRELHKTVESYRMLSSAAQRTSVTAGLAQTGPIAVRLPNEFGVVVAEYARMLLPLVTPGDQRTPVDRSAMTRIATLIGDLDGGPRDLLDVHIAALERVPAAMGGMRSGAILIDARLVALQMMGSLVDYYRVGSRQVFAEHPK